MNFWEKLISPVTSILHSVLDKIAPDKLDEKDRALLKLEAAKIAQEHLMQQEDSFRDFVLDYEGRAKDMPRGIQVLRGSVRPVLTYLLALGWIGLQVYLFIQSGLTPERTAMVEGMMDMLFKLNLVSLGFWYGERLITRTGLLTMFSSVTQTKGVGGSDGK